MALTPATLPRHELIGLQVTIQDANDSSYVDISGEIIRETKQMLHIETDAGVKQVPKQGTEFEFVMPQSPRGLDDGVTVEQYPKTAKSRAGGSSVSVIVEGSRLLSRPTLRSEQGDDLLWR
ncbi:MAG: ribonuclease P protein component 1 [Halobacteriaceae archaeon]